MKPRFKPYLKLQFKPCSKPRSKFHPKFQFKLYSKLQSKFYPKLQSNSSPKSRFKFSPAAATTTTTTAAATTSAVASIIITLAITALTIVPALASSTSATSAPTPTSTSTIALASSTPTPASPTATLASTITSTPTPASPTPTPVSAITPTPTLATPASASSKIAPTLASVPSARAANLQSFYFRDFTADYYLDQAADGTSTLHVKETLTAEFPATDQNHGITRTIPRTNQNGDNIVINSKSALNLKAERNGQPEHINKIEETPDAYTVYLGNADTYVHGIQVYTLEYDFTDVITEFTSAGVNVSGNQDATVAWQELYWDTNGTDWQQRFEKLTANLHFSDRVNDRISNINNRNIINNTNSHADDDTNATAANNTTNATNPNDHATNTTDLTQTPSCYVGRYGADDISAQVRCTITRTSDGYSFTTEDLAAGENLTFAVEFPPSTFTVTLENDYTLVVFFVIELLICGLVFAFIYRRWRQKARPNYQLYRSTFVTPQYLPPKDLSVAEGAQVYIKNVKSTYTATLLEMAVQRKVTIKTLDRSHWSVVLNVDPSTLTAPERAMLQILAYHQSLAQGAEIPIKRHSATHSAANHAADYQTQSCKMATRKGYLVSQAGSKFSGASAFLISFITIWLFLFFSPLITDGLDLLGISQASPNAHVIGSEILPPLILISIVVFIIVIVRLNSKISTYSRYTKKGIAMARYLDGLEQYIKLAEDKRLAFLQSVQGADVSAAGLVHLYEKLLPWASLFGVEKSWASELNQYYETAVAEGAALSDCVCTPSLLDGIIAGNMISHVNHAVISSSSYSNSSSGSSSSSSSGGGGGGFSGGGGGGGGGGGW